MKPKLIIQHGLPGSGKSTASAQYKAEHPEEQIAIINRDEIRTTLFGAKYHEGKPDGKKEAQVSAVQDQLLREYLAKGFTVIDDNTNLNTKTVAHTVALARNYDAAIEQQYMDVPVEECKRRNRARAEAGGRFVPEYVIDSMAEKSYANGHLKEFLLSKNGVFAVPRRTPGMDLLDKTNDRLAQENPLRGKGVLLVDVDGTLVNNQHLATYYLNNPANKRKNFPAFYRSIVDAPVNQNVVELANKMREQDNLNIVVLTGREDSHAAQLLSVVEKSGLKASRVIAKRAGDMRPDGEFKHEVISKLREEGLIPLHALDDRESSIRTMEKHGIMVSRVEVPPVRLQGNTMPEPAAEPKVSTIYGSGHCIRCGSKLKDPTRNLGQRCATKMTI